MVVLQYTIPIKKLHSTDLGIVVGILIEFVVEVIDWLSLSTVVWILFWVVFGTELWTVSLVALGAVVETLFGFYIV